MITKAILTLVLLPFKAALELFPSIDPPDLDGLVASMGPIWQYGGWANNFVPLAESAVLLGLLLTAFGVVFVVRGVLWVLTKAHILGAGD